jgi:hypothetical protein
MSETQKMLEHFNKKYPVSLLDENTAMAVGVLQFCKLDKGRKTEAGKDRYDCAVILHPQANIDPLKEVAKRAWQASPISAKRKTPKQKGLKLQSEMLEAEWPGFGPDGCFFNAMTMRLPECFDINMNKAPADKFYDGCIVRIKVRAYAFDKEDKGNWGVGFSLEGIQFLADGEPLRSNMNSGNASDGFEAAAPAGSGPAKMPNGSAGASADW